MSRTPLLFIPTYNERENVERILVEILGLGIPLDILFMDDNSPDGTGQVLEELSKQHENVRVVHRTGKLGIGTAHFEGIRFAHEQGYETLITMDCDFTHSPTDIPRMLAASKTCDVVVGSRFMQKDSLPGWSPIRRVLTSFGHFLTRTLLGMKYDATGAFRVYNLRRIPLGIFEIVTSRSYAFFFESLFVILKNGYAIREIPIVLPARTYGHSKMSLAEAARSARFLTRLCLESWINPGRFRPARHVELRTRLIDPQGWDSYWERKRDVSAFIYELIAAVYRGLFIKPNLEYAIRKHYPKGSRLLHAGCGSGQVDINLHDDYDITAVDISPEALRLYSQHNPKVSRIEHASIFELPFESGEFDGYYNLGVVEHFTAEEIGRILRECHRVLRPGGKLLIFWPHQKATSVFVLKIAHIILRRVFRKQEPLHPAEISLLSGRNQARETLAAHGFALSRYTFGFEDLFIQAVVVGSRVEMEQESEDAFTHRDRGQPRNAKDESSRPMERIAV